LNPYLKRLGDTLEQAAADDLDATRSSKQRFRRRLIVVVAALAIAIPGIAISATYFISNEEVATSMPAGAAWLEGTDPTCTTVEENVEYHCVLARDPSDAISDWLGTVYETVDSTQHVNGGCRSLSRDGREWQCYIGQRAVEEMIISQDFLGEIQTTPAVG
jgi:hypothetical protein